MKGNRDIVTVGVCIDPYIIETSSKGPLGTMIKAEIYYADVWSEVELVTITIIIIYLWFRWKDLQMKEHIVLHLPELRWERLQ